MSKGVIIEGVETILADIALKRPHVMSFGSISEVNFTLVKIITGDGIVGYGEAATLQGPTWSEETSETIKIIIDRYISPILTGKNPLDYNVLLSEMNSRVKGNHFAKAAVEFALLDIFGKYFGQPVCNLLGGRYRDKVPLSWSLASGSIHGDVEEAKRMIAEGYRIFKVKAGERSPAEDVEKIKVLRAELGDSIRLRVDVNQGWNLSTAIKAIREMETYGVEFVEQPLPKWDVDGMSAIRKKVQVPLMADESLSDAFSCLHVINRAAADIFSFKLTKMGGLLMARNIYAMATAAGLSAYIGCMIETSVGTAAYLQFAASIASLPYGCELFGPVLLSGDIVKNPIAFENGYVVVPGEPGMGVIIDLEQVEKYRRKTASF